MQALRSHLQASCINAFHSLWRRGQVINVSLIYLHNLYIAAKLASESEMSDASDHTASNSVEKFKQKFSRRKNVRLLFFLLSITNL